MRAILSQLFPPLIYWNAFVFCRVLGVVRNELSAQPVWNVARVPPLSHGSGSDCWCWDYEAPLHQNRGLAPPRQERLLCRGTCPCMSGSGLPRLCTNHKELDCCEAVLWFVSNLLPSWLSLSNSRLTEFFIRAFFFAFFRRSKKCVLKFFLINYCHNA